MFGLNNRKHITDHEASGRPKFSRTADRRPALNGVISIHLPLLGARTCLHKEVLELKSLVVFLSPNIYDGCLHKGSLYYYRTVLLIPNIYDGRFKLNVIHEVNASRIKVYVDGDLKYIAPGQGGAFHYFKFGVYAQNNAFYYMESRWTGIRILKKLMD